MNTEIIIALIVLAGTVAGVLGNIYIANRNAKRFKVEDAIKEERLKGQLLEVGKRLDSIEKKLDEHNGYAVKISAIERSIVRLETIASERFK